MNLDLRAEMASTPRPSRPPLLSARTPLAVIVGLKLVPPTYCKEGAGGIHVHIDLIERLLTEFDMTQTRDKPRGNIMGRWVIYGRAR